MENQSQTEKTSMQKPSGKNKRSIEFPSKFHQTLNYNSSNIGLKTIKNLSKIDKNFILGSFGSQVLPRVALGRLPDESRAPTSRFCSRKWRPKARSKCLRQIPHRAWKVGRHAKERSFVLGVCGYLGVLCEFGCQKIRFWIKKSPTGSKK